MNRSLILLPLLVAALAGCKPENKFQPPPPPEITIALPLEQEVVPFEVQTGNTVAFNTVDLVARVEGFLTSQNYVDGAIVKKGDTLFVIEQTMYKAKVQEAEAGLAAAKAQLVQAEAEFSRQQTLLQQNVSAQNVFDQAKAKRDSARANVEKFLGDFGLDPEFACHSNIRGLSGGQKVKPCDIGRKVAMSLRPGARGIVHVADGDPSGIQCGVVKIGKGPVPGEVVIPLHRLH